ncbi:hypothetical protein EYF80_005013 [Liparis tanakae]|uniref:Uncharacterized protein n=1 Tax=Liparis tanakae TaxID=230148 RepID=A0A4Z2J4I1_9TELE|nr:hypothetical protein EYF80_005013 [Liparis tanakae]
MSQRLASESRAAPADDVMDPGYRVSKFLSLLKDEGACGGTEAGEKLAGEGDEFPAPLPPAAPP